MKHRAVILDHLINAHTHLAVAYYDSADNCEPILKALRAVETAICALFDSKQKEATQ